jgi:hypothetical protein
MAKYFRKLRWELEVDGILSECCPVVVILYCSIRDSLNSKSRVIPKHIISTYNFANPSCNRYFKSMRNSEHIQYINLARSAITCTTLGTSLQLSWCKPVHFGSAHLSIQAHCLSLRRDKGDVFYPIPITHVKLKSSDPEAFNRLEFGQAAVQTNYGVLHLVAFPVRWALPHIYPLSRSV